MDRLGNAGRVVVSQASQRKSGTANLPSLAAGKLPAAWDEIDKLARLIVWRGTDGSIEIARRLTDAERSSLERRAAELAPALEPFDRNRPGDIDRVAAAAAEMYGSFPSMRQEGGDALARVDSMMSSMTRHGMPTWAIEDGCRTIQDHGYERKGGDRTWTERQWAPSDSEIAGVVRRIVSVRSEALRNAKAVLAATVVQRA